MHIYIHIHIYKYIYIIYINAHTYINIYTDLQDGIGAYPVVNTIPIFSL